MKTKYVALYRVSTNDQKERKLGLLSQRSNIANYIDNNSGVLLSEYEEIQSGGNKDVISYGADISLDSLLRKRPVLMEALEFARKYKAVIIVKEVSRLTRFSLLYEYLSATGVEFICTDYPTDNAFMLGLRVKFFEQELIEISKRTKAGLAKSTKPRGYKGADNLKKIDRKKNVKIIRQRALDNPNNKRASGYICQLIGAGNTLQTVADKLNIEGFRTSTGCNFQPITVQRLYQRYK